MKIITELWNGEIAPVEHCGSHDADINKLLALRERNSNNLIEGLEDSQKEILQKYIGCSDEYFFRMQELAFYEGFALATRMMVEALTY